MKLLKLDFQITLLKWKFQKGFYTTFLGPEGNLLEHSFLALEEGKPVGVILGGIKDYESIKTMRCGTLAVHPNYRGIGVSQNYLNCIKKRRFNMDVSNFFSKSL